MEKTEVSKDPKIEFLKKNLLYKQVKFALYGLIFMLIMGVFYREFSRPFFKDLSMEDQIFSGYMLSLAHGHSFSLFFLIPLGLCFFTFLIADKMDKEKTDKLIKVFRFYMIAAIGTYFLLLYKGVVHVVYFDPVAGISLQEADEMLYGANIMIRSLIYSIMHVSFGVTIVWYARILGKSMKS